MSAAHPRPPPKPPGDWRESNARLWAPHSLSSSASQSPGLWTGSRARACLMGYPGDLASLSLSPNPPPGGWPGSCSRLMATKLRSKSPSCSNSTELALGKPALLHGHERDEHARGAAGKHGTSDIKSTPTPGNTHSEYERPVPRPNQASTAARHRHAALLPPVPPAAPPRCSTWRALQSRLHRLQHSAVSATASRAASSYTPAASLQAQHKGQQTLF